MLDIYRKTWNRSLPFATDATCHHWFAVSHVYHQIRVLPWIGSEVALDIRAGHWLHKNGPRSTWVELWTFFKEIPCSLSGPEDLQRDQWSDSRYLVFWFPLTNHRCRTKKNRHYGTWGKIRWMPPNMSIKPYHIGESTPWIWAKACLKAFDASFQRRECPMVPEAWTFEDSATWERNGGDMQGKQR